jgi:RNA polymerase sigma-70 factor, ECF subfamily
VTEPTAHPKSLGMHPEKVPHVTLTDEARHAAFTSIFRAEFSYVWNSLKRMGVTMSDLEDLTHEIFCRVFRQLSEYDARRPIRPWLFGFAFRVASDYRRLARHRRELPGIAFEPADATPRADEQLITAEDRARVERALREVPLERRAVIVLNEIDGYSIQEVAIALSLPVNTAYSRLRLGRADLAAAYRQLEWKGGSDAD